MAASTATFRPATLADSDAVAAVYVASRKAFLPYAPSAHTDDEVRDYIRSFLIPQTQVTVPVLDGRIMGLMALRSADGLGWVEQLYLHPNTVGQGIGSNLIERAKTALGPPVWLWTFQQNTGARRFYRRHGFRVVTFTDGADNEERCPDILFEWDDDR
jgi:GNAT superfamily N-acetyltransferase